MGTNENKIPALNAQNFVVWRNRLKLYLDSLELLDVVEGEASASATAEQIAARLKMDKKAKHIIANVVPDQFYSVIDGKTTAKGMMEGLVSHFTAKSVTQQTHIKRELLQLKYKPGQDMSSHFLKFDELVQKLESAGAKMEEEDKISYLFLSLPKEFDPVTTALENMEGLRMNVVKARLLSEEVKQNSRADTEVVDNVSAFRGKRKIFKKKPIECYNCGELGHKQDKCKKPRKAKANIASGVAMVAVTKENNKEKDVVVVKNNDRLNVAMVVNACEKISWELDSGASDHMCNNHELFSCCGRLKSWH